MTLHFHELFLQLSIMILSALAMASYQSFIKYLVKIKVYESKNGLSEEKKDEFFAINWLCRK